jgi:hypothetical protein
VGWGGVGWGGVGWGGVGWGGVGWGGVGWGAQALTVKAWLLQWIFENLGGATSASVAS